ncbi:imidazole glycerol phosphate synthase subunit HisH [Altericroceibacterium endophyticum]|uniref:Imidazole glycerol phosphate synthase subunit HisH n=1 Tax=Altericroceibacterium endophyticum TaxID=1808508 RepID=A0A6I4T9J0_9SPHN|nr:imidazole glycerol phosphate synthase subunit HisH [Altericroceibacterium endophyticum]MXO66952.1 imidazole glycerol phosphate synthase subunit HisH [Altericroceibacterium endophyticum]
MAEALALIDYGAGNLHSVHNALRAAGAEHVTVTADPDLVRGASRIVLPGVGSFRACAAGLKAIDGLVEALEERVMDGGVPFLGICVGMQLLATRGLEHGTSEGLGWIPGEVALIERTDPAVKVPHMGWNDVSPMPHHDGAEQIEAGEAYFLHSYHFAPDNGRDIAAMTDHGGGLVAAVARDNLLGVQFHPEKSQTYGLSLLHRFLEWQP